MEEKVLYEHSWNSKYVNMKDLVKGRVYLTIDNDVLMYLGRAKSGKHLFYRFAMAVTVNRIENRPSQDAASDGPSYRDALRYAPSYRDQVNVITFANYDAQVTGIRCIMEMSMASCADKDCVVGYKKNPGILGEFPCCHYENSCLEWYKKSFAEDDTSEVILEGKMKTDYVAVKDLVPGHIYYSSLWNGSIYCFLGRSSEGLFVWHRLYAGQDFIAHITDPEYLFRRIEVTKSNKQCKPIALALTDEDANAVNQYIRRIIEGNLTVNPAIIDPYRIEQEVRERFSYMTGR